jgi:hypothetical protein
VILDAWDGTCRCVSCYHATRLPARDLVIKKKMACTAAGAVQANEVQILGQFARGQNSETKHPGPKKKKGGWLWYRRVGRISSGDVAAGVLSVDEVVEGVEKQARLECEVYRLADVAAYVVDGDELTKQKVNLPEVAEDVAEGVVEIEDVATDGEAHVGEAAVRRAIGLKRRGWRGVDGEGTGAVPCVADDVIEDNVVGDGASVSCNWSYREAAEKKKGRKILTQWMSPFPKSGRV